MKESIQENPYDCHTQCAKHIGIDKKAVCSILKNDIHIRIINFKRIPYQLSEEIKEKRVEIAIFLLYFLSKSSIQKMNKVLSQDKRRIKLFIKIAFFH